MNPSHPEFVGHLPERVAAVRLAIIDENRLKAELLRAHCISHWGFEVGAIERTGRDGVAAVQRTQPDLVLAGIPESGAEWDIGEFAEHLRRAAPAAKLIFLTARCDEYWLHALGAVQGHSVIYEPEETLASLAQAIVRARMGLRTVSARLAFGRATLRASPTAFPKLLSHREQEVLVCIAHALSDEEIARQIGTASSTALSHRKKIMGKLEIHSTPKLIRYCHEKGFAAAPLPAARVKPRRSLRSRPRAAGVSP